MVEPLVACPWSAGGPVFPAVRAGLLRLGVGDQVAVAHWSVGDGQFEHAVEDQAAAARSASVEAEDELIESFELGGERPGQTWCLVWRT